MNFIFPPILKNKGQNESFFPFSNHLMIEIHIYSLYIQFVFTVYIVIFILILKRESEIQLSNELKDEKKKKKIAN